MTTTATELKNRLGKYLDDALSEPVVVERSGRRSHVILRYEEYERLRAVEDSYWGARARRAEAEGYIGRRESIKFVRSKMRNAEARPDARR